MPDLDYSALDARDDALAGIKKKLEGEGHAVMTAMSGGLGLVYVDGVGPLFIVEVHSAPVVVS